MDFDKQKANILKKMQEADRSKKGGIDEDIRDLLDLINNNIDFCTTSSCSGRIVLIDLRARIKSENEWLLSKHAPVTLEEFNTALEKEKKGIVWFKQEPVILHVMCRNMDSVKKLIGICQKVGFKQIGIISSPRNIVEVMGSETMSVPVYSDKIMINDEYKEFIINEANRKLLVAKDKIAKLSDNFR